ncbi:MAG TPA: HIT family protein [Candidatus Komeilibacteria bacterium]|nr:HIT family protein [Candidatus Komeilibacteria bacterium]
MDCIFCKIVAGELPAAKVYEDKRFLAFLDINPINKGHVLVIPKEHHETLTNTPVDILKDLIAIVKTLAPAVVSGAGAAGFNLGVNNGKAAGQLVDHVHFHIIPRLDNDNLHPWPGKQYAEGEKESYAQRILKSLES